jgi:hypothetical protein
VRGRMWARSTCSTQHTAWHSNRQHGKAHTAQHTHQRLPQKACRSLAIAAASPGRPTAIAPASLCLSRPLPLTMCRW